MTKKRSKTDKKLDAEMSAAMVLSMAKGAVDIKTHRGPLVRLQARAVMHEKLFAERVIADDKEKRKLKKQIMTLQKALAKACDWALDSADVIADEGIMDPEDDEENDFRATIAELRELSKRPEAERHVERRKRQEEEGLAIAVAEVERTGKGYPPANPTADAEPDTGEAS